MSARRAGGQAMLELAIGIPLLLTLLAGGYVACRTAFLSARAGSAAHQAALRAGRRLPGIERPLAASILPSPDGVTIRRGAGRDVRLLPAPFPALAGRSRGTVSVRKPWGETGIASFEPLRLARESEMTADCWERGSRSGAKIRGIVRGRVALGVAR